MNNITKDRYNKIAPFYDFLEFFMELFWKKWRVELWRRIGKGKILEVGVGTGKNIPFYKKDQHITGIDISEGMLSIAEKKLKKLDFENIDLKLCDVQELPFEENSFDFVCCSCVFCSVPDPVRGLREIKRVLKPGGKLLMVEHVISKNFFLSKLMNFFDFIPFTIWGAHIKRDTISNLEMAGFSSVCDENLLFDIVKMIEVEV